MSKKLRRRGPPPVSIIGAGRLASALAIGLAESAYAIRALVARRAASAETAAGLLPRTVPPVQALGVKDLAKLAPTDLILITTPDDAIEEIALHLAGLENSLVALKTGKARGRTVLHTSGALSSVVLASLVEIG